jgi:hypothetical protein
MDYLWIIFGIWAVVAILFFGLIRVEAAKQGAQFNILQVLVAVFWFLWGPWYLYILAKEWWNK